MSADAQHDRALVAATWALVCITAVLVVVTAALAQATYAEAHRAETPAVATTEVVHRDR